MTIVSSGLIGFNDSEQKQYKDDTLVIHRIFSFERFIDFVRNQWLALVRPACWEDPYENPLNREIIETSTGKKLRLPHFEKNLFAQCWSICSESDAMWRIYSSDKRGVLVSASARDLLQYGKTQYEAPLEQVFLGKVIYNTHAQLQKMLESKEFLRSVLCAPGYSHNSSSVLLHKRDSFEHEEEVRLIISRHISEVPGEVARFEIPLPKVVLQVTLDPRLTPEEFERSSYLISRAGYTGYIEQSKLYSTPELKLEIPSLEWLYEKDS
ncbi:MAG: DUF2971 domain-containing protein [Candidatus Electrothrix sp. AR3]|nr:DUF2971 domain-containing protein [Candidatus Electrothrix sp. AR3]